MITLADLETCYTGFRAAFGYAPDALALHPSDVRALRDAVGPLFIAPPGDAPETVLGMRLYQTRAAPPGKLYMADQASVEDWIAQWAQQQEAGMNELARLSQEMGVYD